jgi:hypothetical protein
MARSLLGKFCRDSKPKLESGRGILRLTIVLAQAEKYDCNCGQWSERLVIQDPTAAATKFCSQMCRLSMENMVLKYGLNRGLLSSSGRGVRAIALSTIYYGTASKLPFRWRFPLARSGRMVHDLSESPLHRISAGIGPSTLYFQ